MTYELNLANARIAQANARLLEEKLKRETDPRISGDENWAWNSEELKWIEVEGADPELEMVTVNIPGLVTLDVAAAKIEKDIKSFKRTVYREASEAEQNNVYAYLADKIASKSDILDSSKQQFEKDGWSEKDFVLQYIKESNYLA